jgi:hypothetical protein
MTAQEQFEAMLILRMNALQYWVAALYERASGGRPGLMADMIDQRLHSLKVEPPKGPVGMSPADLDQVMLAELPAVLQVGAEIRDHLKAVQRTIDYNRRFLQMCGHYLVDPVACTPASGWEKGQVENQVGLVRERFFTPRLRVKSYEELNAWLMDQCIAYAKAHRHPEFRDQTVWETFEAERPSLVPYAGRFDGFHATPASVSKTCLVRFDNNKYSVMASAVGRPAEIRAYADRIELRQDGRLVGEHPRCFGRDQTVYDPWHYVPVLARKPGALRNGAPFKDWVLPASLERVRRKLAGSSDGDRQMVDILTTVLSDGLPAVEAACAEALREGVHSAAVILNILARQREPAAPITIMTPDALRLRHAPVADCARYDNLRRAV